MFCKTTTATARRWRNSKLQHLHQIRQELAEFKLSLAFRKGDVRLKSSGFPMISGDKYIIYICMIYMIYDIWYIYIYLVLYIYDILYVWCHDASNLVISGELVNQMMTGILYLVISGALQIFPTMTLGIWRHAISASGSKLPWFFSAELLWTRLAWKLSPWHGPPQRKTKPDQAIP